jgi:hypothetical protein
MKTFHKPSCLVPFALALIANPGCSYSTKRPFPESVQTVAVDMFHSKEFRRELEFDLTEAVVKRIQMDTPYRIRDRKVADTLLEGEILEVRQNAFADEFGTGRPREVAATIVVSCRWKDLRDGKILMEVPRLTYTTSWIPPVRETFAKGMVRGMDGLAEKIVETMESDW